MPPRQLLKRIVKQYDTCELAATQRFVKEELSLPYSWIAPSLLQCFRTRVHNAGHPDDERQFGVPVYVLPEQVKGKEPAHTGADLRRNVNWYYRHTVRKWPEDSNRALMREYAASVNREDHEKSWGVVQNGIKQVRSCLDLIEQRYIVEKPGYVVTREQPELK